jgi:hypothetical protein
VLLPLLAPAPKARMAGHHVNDRGHAIEDHPPTRLAGTDLGLAPRVPAVTGVGVEWVW